MFDTVKLPAGKVLIPGVIESKSNFIEHPGLIAQRIGRYAKLVGRDNVIAGSDCGYGTWVGQAAVDPDVVWAKMAAMAEGARIASRQFWNVISRILQLSSISRQAAIQPSRRPDPPMTAPGDHLGPDHPSRRSAGLARKPAAADPDVPAAVRAGGDGLFRLWRARPDRRHARPVDQGKPVAVAVAARRHRGLADPAMDREDGVRRARRHRADLRLAAEILHHHRRGADGARPADLAGAAGGWLTFARADQLYVLGAMLLVIGTVMQDVVADAMSTEVVPRTDEAGRERPDDVVRVELGMVQVLGRLAVSCGILAVAGLSGWLANMMPRQAVFLLGLIIPAISVDRRVPARHETIERRADRLAHPRRRHRVRRGRDRARLRRRAVRPGDHLRDLDGRGLHHAGAGHRRARSQTRMGILFTTIIVFAFRATPSVGDGFFWWTLDELKFDAAFYGTLRQTGAILSIAVMWMFSRQLTEYSVTKTLFWIAVASTVLALPNIGLVYGLHEWTEATFGFGARTIAVVDAAAASPFVQLSMIPLLTLIAYYAPPGHRATWFALMASLMNLALVASQLQTKYLNEVFVVGRGHYAELGPLLIWAVALGFVIPVAAIVLFGRRAVRHAALRALKLGGLSRAVRIELFPLRRPGRKTGGAVFPRGHAPVQPDRRAGLHPHPAGRALLQAIRRLQPQPAALPDRRGDGAPRTPG